MFLFRKVALVAVALAVAASARAADAQKFLPDDTKAVISLNLRQLLGSDLVKKAGVDKAAEGDGAKKATEQLGFNPLKDVDHVVIAASDKEDETLIIVGGRFDTAALKARMDEVAKKKAENIRSHKAADGATYYELSKLDELVPVPPQAQGQMNLKGKAAFLAAADKNHVLMAMSKDAIETALAKAAGKKTTALKAQDLGDLVKNIDPKQTVAVAIPGSATMNEKIKSITGGLTVAADILLDVRITAADLSAAKEINDQIGEGLQAAQGFVGAFAAQQKALAPVVDILAAVKHDAKDKDVSIKTTIKAETLEQLAKALAAMQRGGGF